MTGCAACGEQPKNTAKDFTKAVIEINNPEEIILFRKVVIPTSMGDDTAVPAAIGKYRNVLLVYEANNHAYLYSSDGIPTLLTSDVAQELEQEIRAVADDLATETVTRQNADIALGGRIDTVEHDLAAETLARGNADTNLQGKITDEKTARENADAALDNRLAAVEGIAETAVQPTTIDKTVVTNLSVNSGTTTTIQLDSSKQNILSGSTSTNSIVLPVASHDTAGVMNQATYDAVSANTSNINAIMNGAVAISGLSANPTQADITAAWRQETGLTTLINRAAVYDVTNDKVWTYYTNDTTWHAASNTTQVTVSTFTNSSEGVIKGSTNTGQVYAENDGTGSVNGWDTLNNTVSGKQDALTAGSNITITGTTIAASNNKAGQSSSTTNGDFPVLLKNTANTTNETAATKYNGSFTFNPSTGKVKATSGSIASGDANLVTGGAVNSALSNYATTASLATVATSGSYNDLLNKPTIPAAQVNSDWNANSGVAQILNKPSLATVATSGSYNDLTNKPTIPAAQVQSNWTQTNTSSVDYIKNKPSLATVATSGAYSDLTGKPTIPTVNNATLTIQKNGTTVNSFTANASSNVTANITVPTKVSDLTSDAGGNVFVGSCDTAAATTAKVITVSSDQNFALKKGAVISVKVTNTNTANNPTFNVNSTGAKSVVYNTAVITTSNLNRAGYASRYCNYIYDGTNWVFFGWSLDSDTTYSAMSVSEGTTGTATSSRVMRADYLKQIIQHYIPTNVSSFTNDAGYTTNTGTITKVQANGTDVASSGTANIPAASTSAYGVTKLSTSTSSTSTDLAATPSAVKSAYDLANGKATITMQTTDPGEGAALAANNFIAVYNAS